MMQKNELVKVKIEDIGVGGEGIGKVDGYTLFIKDTIIGDVVEAKVMKAKKNYGYARLMNVLTPSEDRVEKVVCPMARKCGGCQIQEMKYPAQLAFKESKVRGNLERIGEVPGALLDQIMHPVVGMDEEGMQPFRYRNKAQFPIGTDKDGRVTAGFYAGRTHSIIGNTDCVLGVEVNEEILNCILDFMEEFEIPAYDEVKHKGLVRHVLLRYGFKTDEIMVCLVINGKTIPHCHDLVGRLRQIPGMTSITLSSNTAKTNVIMGDTIRLLWGQEFITDYIGEIKYQISPLSFYQVNPVQTEKLYRLALDYAGLTGNETVWDLYCGIGTISLFLAKKAKQVYGVEIIPQAIDDAKNNAKINNITNAEFYVGKAEEVLPEYYKEYEKTHNGETAHADVIVVKQRAMIAMGIIAGADMILADEPTKGLDEERIEMVVDAFHSLKDQAVLCVTHDLNFAREISDSISVMYASNQVEYASAKELLEHPLHPYTQDMIAAMPENGLHFSEGFAMAHEDYAEGGCKYAPRCRFCKEKCKETPPMLEVEGHQVRCWLYTGKEGECHASDNGKAL